MGKKKKVEIFMCTTVGIIVPCKSGVVWSNQVGGTACFHPEVEGIFIPLPDNRCFVDGYDKDGFGVIRERCEVKHPESSELILKFLKATGLNKLFEMRLNMKGVVMHEAWVPLKIKKKLAHPPHELLNDFRGRDVILTYENSD